MENASIVYAMGEAYSGSQIPPAHACNILQQEAVNFAPARP
jgi:hypothetical protein